MPKQQNKPQRKRRNIKGIIGGSCLLAVIAYLLITNPEQLNNGSEPQTTVQDTPIPENEAEVLDNNDTYTSDQAFEQELQQKAEALSKEEHYQHSVDQLQNAEQLGREGVYDRTSYYDEPIGYIESKAVGVSETIYAGASELNMRRGVATVEYQEQLNEQTVAIAGHRSPNRTQFLTGALYLEKGDEITVTEYKQGTTQAKTKTTYVVDNTLSVTPSSVEVLKPDNSKGKRKLILITCFKYNQETGLYDERFIVNAYEK